MNTLAAIDPRSSRQVRASARWASLLASAVWLAACGGGEAPAVSTRPAPATAAAQAVPRPADSAGPAAAAAAASTPSATPEAAPAVGDGRGTLQSVTALASVPTSEVARIVNGSQLPLAPAYDVRTYRLTYTTLDGQGRPIVASGLLALPLKGGGARSPLISYQHGTIFQDADAPSHDPTASEPAVIMASLGFVVVAADYVGYGASKGTPHPYLLAGPTAAAVVDLLAAVNTPTARSALRTNGQLFLVGYSEGGYASVAAHRAIQAAGGELAAMLVGSVPGAGPLDVGATLDELLRRVRHENPLLAFLVNPDLLQNLGSSLRRRVRDELLKKLLPGDADVVFQSTFIDNFLANDRAAINRDSDVHDWRPAAPVRLFHGRDDQTVPFIGSLSALQSMQARGAPNVLLTECRAVPADHLPCVLPYWGHMLSQIGLVVRDL